MIHAHTQTTPIYVCRCNETKRQGLFCYLFGQNPINIYIEESAVAVEAPYFKRTVRLGARERLGASVQVDIVYERITARGAFESISFHNNIMP